MDDFFEFVNNDEFEMPYMPEFEEIENDMIYEHPKESDYEYIKYMSFETIANTMKSLTPCGSVKKEIIVESSTRLPDLPTMAHFKYISFLEYGERPVDSTYLRNVVEKVFLPENPSDSDDLEIIPGLYFALKSMRKGEKSIFLISPNYAFGELGIFPRIPPNSTCNLQNSYISQLFNFNTKMKSTILIFIKFEFRGEPRTGQPATWPVLKSIE